MISCSMLASHISELQLIYPTSTQRYWIKVSTTHHTVYYIQLSLTKGPLFQADMTVSAMRLIEAGVGYSLAPVLFKTIGSYSGYRHS